MEKPILREVFIEDDGEHFYWELSDTVSGEILWREEFSLEYYVTIEGDSYLKRSICDIYDIESNKSMFLNREAGFIVKTFAGELKKYGESIPYESTFGEIAEIKYKWNIRMNKAIEAWQK